MARRTPSELNLLLAVDKPTGISSHDAVSRVRRALHERRVGHAGTLDPLASGVLVMGVGQATRLLGLLALERKSYVAELAFGAETVTDDAEGEVSRTAAVPAELGDSARARKVLAGFLGKGEQVPPAYSAISVNGVRSYKRARAGEDVELPARPIEVLAANLLSVAQADAREPLRWTVAFTVSKGTYIRSLARDIGRAAGSAAHLTALRRTASGSVSLGRAVSLDELDAQRARASALDPAAVLGLPVYEVDASDVVRLRNGQALPVPGPLPVGSASSDEVSPGRYALVYAGALVAIACRQVDARRAKLVPQTVFPQPIEGVKEMRA